MAQAVAIKTRKKHFPDQFVGPVKVKVDPPPPFQLSFSAGEREKAKVVENTDFEGKEEEEEKTSGVRKLCKTVFHRRKMSFSCLN